MNRDNRAPVRREQAGYSGGSRNGAAARPKRMFGRPDWWVWIPILGILEAAYVLATLAASTLTAGVLIAIGVVLVIADCWFNR
ncbi:hypothetical protein AB0N05_12575 [Nocardia sp. NPDC051030]|uniref:hypothetical protein n=1 Tax=Nocardia sp. NPDC051030 TaxID=3155162 RepID=UPI0034334C1A